MDSMEIAVVILVAGSIAFVLWWFFGAREETAAQVAVGSSVQELEVIVKGGYSPDRIVVKQGIPVRLNFRREETNSCSEQVVLSDFGIVRDLPAFKTTPVEFTPDKPGEYSFTCGMNMMHGKVVVTPVPEGT